MLAGGSAAKGAHVGHVVDSMCSGYVVEVFLYKEEAVKVRLSRELPRCGR